MANEKAIKKTSGRKKRDVKSREVLSPREYRMTHGIKPSQMDNLINSTLIKDRVVNALMLTVKEKNKEGVETETTLLDKLVVSTIKDAILHPSTGKLKDLSMITGEYKPLNSEKNVKVFDVAAQEAEDEMYALFGDIAVDVKEVNK